MLSDVSEFENYENLLVRFFVFVTNNTVTNFCIICVLNGRFYNIKESTPQNVYLLKTLIHFLF